MRGDRTEYNEHILSSRVALRKQQRQRGGHTAILDNLSTTVRINCYATHQVQRAHLNGRAGFALKERRKRSGRIRLRQLGLC